MSRTTGRASSVFETSVVRNRLSLKKNSRRVPKERGSPIDRHCYFCPSHGSIRNAPLDGSSEGCLWTLPYPTCLPDTTTLQYAKRRFRHETFLNRRSRIFYSFSTCGFRRACTLIKRAYAGAWPLVLEFCALALGVEVTRQSTISSGVRPFPPGNARRKRLNP